MNELKLLELVQSGVFEIDDEGHIWRTNWGPRHRAENDMGSYLQIRAMIDGVRYYAMAHRLVWVWLVGPIPSGMEINHRNGKKQDNRLSNLEVVSASENVKHAYRIGLKDESGEHNPAAKLTDAEIEQIRTLYATGHVRQGELATQFSVAFQTISKIVRGERRRRQAGPVDNKDHRDFWGQRNLTTGQFSPSMEDE